FSLISAVSSIDLNIASSSSDSLLILRLPVAYDLYSELVSYLVNLMRCVQVFRILVPEVGSVKRMLDMGEIKEHDLKFFVIQDKFFHRLNLPISATDLLYSSFSVPSLIMISSHSVHPSKASSATVFFNPASNPGLSTLIQ